MPGAKPKPGPKKSGKTGKKRESPLKVHDPKTNTDLLAVEMQRVHDQLYHEFITHFGRALSSHIRTFRSEFGAVQESIVKHKVPQLERKIEDLLELKENHDQSMNMVAENSDLIDRAMDEFHAWNPRLVQTPFTLFSILFWIGLAAFGPVSGLVMFLIAGSPLYLIIGMVWMAAIFGLAYRRELREYQPWFEERKRKYRISKVMHLYDRDIDTMDQGLYCIAKQLEIFRRKLGVKIPEELMLMIEDPTPETGTQAKVTPATMAMTINDPDDLMSVPG